MHSLHEAPLHSPSSTSVRQLDVMSTSWNELLRHWRSGYLISCKWYTCTLECSVEWFTEIKCMFHSFNSVLLHDHNHVLAVFCSPKTICWIFWSTFYDRKWSDNIDVSMKSNLLCQHRTHVEGNFIRIKGCFTLTWREYSQRVICGKHFIGANTRCEYFCQCERALNSCIPTLSIFLCLFIDGQTPMLYTDIVNDSFIHAYLSRYGFEQNLAEWWTEWQWMYELYGGIAA